MTNKGATFDVVDLSPAVYSRGARAGRRTGVRHHGIDDDRILDCRF
jgi:hypothetical protein